jgi:hypothetical protein
MFDARIEHISPLQSQLARVKAILKYIKNSHPFKSTKQTHSNLEAALERIAETSPHLLQDIGYQRATEVSNPDLTIWTHDQTTIELVECHTPSDMAAMPRGRS